MAWCATRYTVSGYELLEQQERAKRRWPGQLSRITANATKSAASEIRRHDKAKYVLQFGMLK
jgi:hypothetical protein